MLPNSADATAVFPSSYGGSVARCQPREETVNSCPTASAKIPTRQQGAHLLLRLEDTIRLPVFQISNSSEDEARPIRGQATELRPRPVTLDKEIHKRRAPSLLTILSTGFQPPFNIERSNLFHIGDPPQFKETGQITMRCIPPRVALGKDS